MSQERKYRKKKKLGSYPYLSVVFSTTLALFAIGLFGLLLMLSLRLTGYIQQNVEMQVYLSKSITTSEKTKIQKIISEKQFILDGSNEAIRYISKEDAAADFIKATGEDFINFLGDNPLRDAFSIKIDPAFHSNEQMAQIKTDLERISGVFEVVYTENLVQNINENITKIGLVLSAIAVLLLLTVIILINNTIKLALFSQRFLIRSMQLVGAKASFIQWPFLRRSMLHGFLAGILSSIALFGLLQYGNQRIEGLEDLQQLTELVMLFAALCTIGVFITLMSTYHSIRKYLNMSLDELY